MFIIYKQLGRHLLFGLLKQN